MYIYSWTIILSKSLQIITTRIFLKYIVAVINVMIAAKKSTGYFTLLDKFNRYDKFTLQIQCPANPKTQIYYLLFTFLVECYYSSITFHYTSNKSIIILIMWFLISMSTMLMLIQYRIFVGILRERYTLANYIFSSSKYH